MKFENTYVGNIEGAIRGMRNPLASWDKSDSHYETLESYINHAKKNENIIPKYIIGEKDMDLAQRLIKAGPEHRKFLRQIFVSVDITAPIYWWKEMSTYKIATVANSTSTMHKIASTPITIDCFETGDFEKDLEYYCGNTIEMFSDLIIEQLEFLRKKYDETKDIKYWKELIRWLPESWLQKRTWSANYETLYSIILQRGRHKLETEWGKGFIHWCTTLPYAKELLFLGEARESLFDLYK